MMMIESYYLGSHSPQNVSEINGQRSPGARQGSGANISYIFRIELPTVAAVHFGLYLPCESTRMEPVDKTTKGAIAAQIKQNQGCKLRLLMLMGLNPP